MYKPVIIVILFGIYIGFKFKHTLYKKKTQNESDKPKIRFVTITEIAIFLNGGYYRLYDPAIRR